jgi:hypothetical protein
VESVARNFGDSRYFDKKVRMIQTTDFHRRCDRKGFPEELLADVARTHELLNVCRVLHERNNVAHLATHARENGRYVFKDLANLSAHIPSADDLIGLIESNLAPSNQQSARRLESRPSRKRQMVTKYSTD